MMSTKGKVDPANTPSVFGSAERGLRVGHCERGDIILKGAGLESAPVRTPLFSSG